MERTNFKEYIYLCTETDIEKNKFQTPVRLNTTNIKTKMTKTPEKMLNTQIQCERIMAAAGEVGERKHTDYPPKDQHKLVLFGGTRKMSKCEFDKDERRVICSRAHGYIPICPNLSFSNIPKPGNAQGEYSVRIRVRWNGISKQFISRD